MAIWADRASPDAAPLYPATERIERDFPAARAKWMLKRGRNILVFPNLVLNDLASTHMRTHRPLGPERCEVTIWCIAPRGEPAEARSARLRKFEDFFLVTGLATSDDVVSLDTAQAGAHGREAGWNEFTRGITTFTDGPDEAARELGLDPVSSGATWDSENTYIGFYRNWRELLSAPPTAMAAE
jgi:benzoate/toluate 1,2-dioxygenase alpha subunit